ncbi:hypothetical protein CA54_34860 [Symmachiella macrocystis]|uniref:Uncharacterized protein n=1 Tax=Symmachiella macrocystis TaxID=2527985 RepID=A0A5C6BS69_9PLAN|nr:hypothetical protein [Symmachiella macrocystis]TWU14617.1 hypothetical protein CA54_34860 [Symmachiella macrocystis]
MFISREKIRKHRHVWLFFGVWLPMTILAVLWFGFSPDVPNQAIRAERDAEGNFIEQLLGDESEPAAGVTFEAQFGKLNAKNNLASSASSTSSNPSFFADSHIAIINRSDHTLMKRVGGLVLERLKQQPAFQRIDYYPLGESMPQGERAPDIFVSLDLKNLEESGLLIEHAVQAKISIVASDNVVRSHNSYIDNLTPPKIEFDWHGKLEHDSTTTGIGSSAAKYKLVAEDIAKQIADAMVKHFDGLREKHSMLPPLPNYFYPDFKETEPLTFLENHNAELLFSGHGLMNRNQSVWTFQADEPPQDLLRAISDELATQGWDVPELAADESVQHLRVKHNNFVLEVFPDHESRTDLDINGNLNGGGQSRRYTYYVSYLDRMQREEIRAACEAFLTEKPPVEALVLFHRHWYGDRDLESRVLSYLQSQSTTSIEALIATAELLHRLKRADEALHVILTAHALSETTSDPGKYKNRLKQLAKTMKIEDFPPKTIDVELLKELGIREVEQGSKFADLEFAVNEPAVFIYRTLEGTTKLLSFRVVPLGNHQFEFAFVDSEPDKGSRSWGNGGLVSEDRWTSHQIRLGDSSTLRFYARKLEGKPRFRVAVDVIDRKNLPPQLPYE